MRKNKTDRQVVVVLVMTLITLVAWVGFEVYRAYTLVNIPSVSDKQLLELSPTLDIPVLEKLESRTP